MQESYLKAPAILFGHPANFGATHRAANPVAAPAFHQHNLAFRTGKGFSTGHQSIDHFFGPLGIFVGFGFLGHLVLVLLAVNSFMNSLTGEAVGVAADRTAEDVDIVVDDAPAGAVGRLTVKGVLHLFFGQSHGTSQMLFVRRRRYNSFDFPFLQRTVASVVIVAVRAAHCSLVAQFDDVSQAILAKAVQTIAQNDSDSDWHFHEADAAVKSLRIGHGVALFEMQQFLIGLVEQCSFSRSGFRTIRWSRCGKSFRQRTGSGTHLAARSRPRVQQGARRTDPTCARLSLFRYPPSVGR